MKEKQNRTTFMKDPEYKHINRQRIYFDSAVLKVEGGKLRRFGYIDVFWFDDDPQHEITIADWGIIMDNHIDHPDWMSEKQLRHHIDVDIELKEEMSRQKAARRQEQENKKNSHAE